MRGDVCGVFYSGLNVEGLYRMGGQTEEVMKIKADFDRGENPTQLALHDALQCSVLWRRG